MYMYYIKAEACDMLLFKAVTVTVAATVGAHQAHVVLVVAQFTIVMFGPLSTKLVMITAVWLELMLAQY